MERGEEAKEGDARRGECTIQPLSAFPSVVCLVVPIETKRIFGIPGKRGKKREKEKKKCFSDHVLFLNPYAFCFFLQAL